MVQEGAVPQAQMKVTGQLCGLDSPPPPLPGSNTSVVFLVYVDFLISLLPKDNSFQISKESVYSEQVVS